MRARNGLAVIATAAVLCPGCRVAEPVSEFDETPTIALLIATDTLPTGDDQLPSDSGVYATLVTTGTPYYSPYLRAERFEMRRARDGARFAWRPIDTDRQAITVAPPSFERSGNYFLPRHADAAGLGSDSIAPGEVYELVVEAGPHVVTGRTRVPGPIEVVREAADGDTIVRWRRAPGAAAYSVAVVGASLFNLRRIADTAVVVRQLVAFFQDQEGPNAAVVVALDSNYAQLSGDFRVGRAGVSGAWGVFGSITWTRVELPPPQVPASSR